MSKLTDALNEMGIRNTDDLVERFGQPKAYLTYETQHAHAFGHSDYRIAVRWLGSDKKFRTKTLRPRIYGEGAKGTRERHLEYMLQWLKDHTETWGSIEWVRDPFTQDGWQWIPKSVREAMDEAVKAHQVAKKTEAKG